MCSEYACVYACVGVCGTGWILLTFLYNSTISMHVCLAADRFFYTFAHGGNRLCGSFFGVYRCKVLDTITHKITWQGNYLS